MLAERLWYWALVQRAALGQEEPFQNAKLNDEKGRIEPFGGRDPNGGSWHSDAGIKKSATDSEKAGRRV
jgi:hypothetical protein